VKLEFANWVWWLKVFVQSCQLYLQLKTVKHQLRVCAHSIGTHAAMIALQVSFRMVGRVDVHQSK
jgi:hypothetical protein